MGQKTATYKSSIGFNAQHSPMGAFFSFTCGMPGVRGGIAAELGKPAEQDLYIGVKDGRLASKAPLRCLPFYKGADGSAAEAFLVGQSTGSTEKAPPLLPYSLREIERRYSWSNDCFRTKDFDFGIFHPFHDLGDPRSASAQQLRDQLLPAVLAELTVDNRKGSDWKTGVFAIKFTDKGARLIEEGLGEGRLGFAFRRSLGAAGEMLGGEDASGKKAPASACPIFRWSAVGAVADVNKVHYLGDTPGIAFEVPPGEIRTLRLALGCHLAGPVTTRIEGGYYYTRYFASLEDVLTYALDHYEPRRDLARAQGEELAKSNLSPDQQFLLAHATHSYYGSTQLLDVGGEPFWIVNEGEYCMLNTLDLSVDHVFWELKRNPWVVRNLLETFVRHYSFRDQVKVPDGKGGFVPGPGGISFCHDMGVHNNFSPRGQSSYEMPHLNALCFSHMTVEQLCNWSLMAGCYVAATGDAQWLHHNAPLLQDCLRSMQNRDHVDESRRKGIMQLDSFRCGAQGAEITTYDSLDHSLAQSRNNLYIATKCWATYLSLAMLFEKLGDSAHQQQALTAADLAATTIAAQMNAEGFIPAVFEKDNAGHGSRILPAIEALVYPLYWRDLKQPAGEAALAPGGRFAKLLAALRQHTQTLLCDTQNRNRFADGGLRLSSTSSNSWMSKIAIAQTVARRLWGFDRGDQRQAAADAAHVNWQTNSDSAYWAMSDQIVNGVAKGSKYYPRCVTAMLWLSE
jgi:hypothetical protein